jgi:hypothetical protein
VFANKKSGSESRCCRSAGRAAVLISTGPDEYYFGGAGGAMRIGFAANTPSPGNVGVGDVQEGRFVDGKWIVTR